MSVEGTDHEQKHRRKNSLTTNTNPGEDAVVGVAESEATQAGRATKKVANGAQSTLLGAALEAWAACHPVGHMLPESSISVVLPVISCHVPGSFESSGTATMLDELFKPVDGAEGCEKSEPSVFEAMLRARNGRVHFLYFWNAFSEAARLLARLSEDGEAATLIDDSKLTSEIESLRDGILMSFEAKDVPSLDSFLASSSSSPATLEPELSITRSELVAIVQNVAAISSSASFWQAAEQSLMTQGSLTTIGIHDLTDVMLSWHSDAVAQQQRERRESSKNPEVITGGSPVFVHVYDVSEEEGIQKVNNWLASKNSYLKFGGLFHAGVEVNGLEWSYGMTCEKTMAGISCILPKSHTVHHYRQTVQLRNTKLTPEEIADLLQVLIEEYPGDDYDLLRRNCCHWADDFCKRIGAGRMPGWIYRLSRVGAFADKSMQLVLGRKLLNLDGDDQTQNGSPDALGQKFK